MKKKFKSGPILERIKTHYRLPDDASLGRFLDLSKQTVNNWKHDRAKLDFVLIMEKCREMDFNILFKGIPLEPAEAAELVALKARIDALEKARRL